MASYDSGYGSVGDNDPDDIVIGAFTADGFDADAAEKENGFRDVPPGDHLLIVQSVKVNEQGSFTVTLDGRKAVYASHTIQVRMCLPDDKRATITDFFVLPPANPAEMAAYRKGQPAAKDGNSQSPPAGASANKFLHFAERLGLLDSNKQLTREGSRTGAWKGRPILATVTAGSGTYWSDKKQCDVPRSGQIKMYSYKLANGVAGSGSASHAHAGHNANAPSNGGQRPAPVGGRNDLDNVLDNM